MFEINLLIKKVISFNIFINNSKYSYLLNYYINLHSYIVPKNNCKIYKKIILFL